MTRTGVFLSLGMPADAALFDPDYAERAIERARAARIDLLLLGEQTPPIRALRFDPLIAASWLAPRAGSVGIVPHITVLSSEPFHVARALSALDHLTGGRSGWLPGGGVSSGGPPGSALPATDGDEEERIARAVDFVAATLSLWDSWDADALIIDAATGVYLDPSKVRPSAYRGKYFQVLGPLNAARPPQGHPILVQSDADPWGSQIAADVLITALDAPRPPRAAKLARRIHGVAWSSAFIDDLEQRWRADELEGIHLELDDPLVELADFVSCVMPELERRGMRAAEDPSGSLRARLGLRVPEAARPATEAAL
jgi:alkanesulfonate monooxygenase SsuD/methylene tetrahydromethanopterin reductase-like flavin-dependent oxidoreductase (luciferase family)